MTSQLKQLLFFSILGFVCCVIVFLVPFGSSKSSTNSEEIQTSSGEWFLKEQKETMLSQPELSWAFQIQIAERFLTPSLKKLISDFEKNYQIKVHLAPSFLQPDLVLEEKSEQSWLNLNFSKDISEYFLTGVRMLVQKEQIVPFTLDPLVAYVLESGEISWDISLWSENWHPKSASSSLLFPPFVFLSWDHVNTLAQTLLITELAKINDIAGFETLLAQYGDITLATKLFSLFEKQKACQKGVLKCLVKQGFLAVAFDFSSMLHGDRQLRMLPFPSYLDRAYTKLYAWTIPQTSKNPEWARLFLLDFVRDGNFDEIAQYLGTISPLMQQGDSIAEDIYQNLEILDQDRDFLSSFQKQLLQKVLEKKINPDLYLERASIY